MLLRILRENRLELSNYKTHATYLKLFSNKILLNEALKKFRFKKVLLPEKVQKRGTLACVRFKFLNIY